MALISCTECNKSISDSAKICPHCGYKKEKKSYFWFIILILLFLGLCQQDEILKSYKSEKPKVVKKLATEKPQKKEINLIGRAQLKAQYNDPGYVESDFPQKETFWIFIKEPPKGESAVNYARIVCQQAKNKYNTKGFVITIWGLLDRKKHGKFPCF